MNKKLAGILFKYLLGVGLLVWVVAKYWHLPDPDHPEKDVGLSTLGERTFDWLNFGLASVLCCASVLITFYRWYLLVRAQDLPFTLPNAMRLGLVGFYFNSFLPGSVGGDLIKAYFISREQNRRTVAVATVILDRLLGLFALLALVAILGSFFWYNGLLQTWIKTEDGLKYCEWVIVLVTGITLGVSAGWLVLVLLPQAWFEWVKMLLGKIPKLGGIFVELCNAVWMYRNRSGIVFLALLTAFVSHFGFVLTYHYSALVLSSADDVPAVGVQFLIIPVGMTMQSLVPAPGGVGGGEAIFGKIYELVGNLAVAGVLMSLVYRCINWVLGIIGYIVYLRMEKRATPVAEATTIASGVPV